MGQRILLSCTQCNHKKEMSVGVGLMSNNPDVIASCLNADEAEVWRQLNHNQKISFFQAEQKVFYCSHCNELFCQLSADLTLTDGSEVTLGNKCQVCQTNLQEIDTKAKPMCPICHSGILERKEIGLWD
ncbi:MAG: hypothetical protein HDR09_18645 [Lachnospiraceae bacterium]|nr:hypothetical protein [Lachnospiraceae bacterium]